MGFLKGQKNRVPLVDRSPEIQVKQQPRQYGYRDIHKLEG